MKTPEQIAAMYAEQFRYDTDPRGGSILEEVKKAILDAIDFDRSERLVSVAKMQDEPNDDREALSENFRNYLSNEIYVCSRDYSAWSHGTMGFDDFSLAAEDDGVIESLVQIASRAIMPDVAQVERADREADNLYDSIGVSVFREEFRKAYADLTRSSTAPDATTERIAELEAHAESLKAALGGRESSPQEWNLMERLEAALAALERVRALAYGNFKGQEDLPVDRYALKAALDGAPEPGAKQ